MDGADAPPEESTTPPSVVPLAGVLGTLVVSNVMANRILPGWAYVPWNCAIAATVVTIAVKADDQSLATMGLSRDTARRGLRLGLTLSGLIVAGCGIAFIIPGTRDVFIDDRVDLSAAGLAYKVLIEVPLGTVLMEEVAFRGVLPAMFRRRVRPGTRAGFTADALAAALFGMWHILPSWEISDANSIFRDTLPDGVGQATAILGTVLVTAVAGMGLSWMRNRSDSVVAPAAVHTTTNSVASVFSWLASRLS